MNLLLLSSSRVGNTAYLEHAEYLLKQHIDTSIKKLLFIPFAGVAIDFSQYEEMVSKAFRHLGYQIESLHHSQDPISQVNSAEAVVVGGGNTFNLLNCIYQKKILEPLQQLIKRGTPYVGWSAGSNIAAPTICTTNDMPIVEPPSFKSLNLVPFQINPHYLEGNPPGHNGETREQRINEYLIANPNKRVVGIPEGTALQLKNNKLTYLGDKSGVIFSSYQQEESKQLIQANSNISHLLNR
ncbi:dipeptidase PepE [Aliikangiella sp. IMCC44359]|uniref:dipeptidase PepE n=1 Tax=Aliikangiella sp. IMCC44359 TaxID=3459125 RepID=UPI00403AB48F